MRRFGKQPFAWNGNVRPVDRNITSEDDMHHKNSEDDTGNQYQNGTDGQNVVAQTCRNSVQGRTLIADDRGKSFTIKRSEG